MINKTHGPGEDYEKILFSQNSQNFQKVIHSNHVFVMHLLLIYVSDSTLVYSIYDLFYSITGSFIFAHGSVEVLQEHQGRCWPLCHGIGIDLVNFCNKCAGLILWASPCFTVIIYDR